MYFVVFKILKYLSNSGDQLLSVVSEQFYIFLENCKANYYNL